MARINQVVGANNFINGQSANYSALPTASEHSGEIYICLASEGVYILNRKSSGMYYSNGSAWTFGEASRSGITTSLFFQIFSSCIILLHPIVL